METKKIRSGFPSSDVVQRRCRVYQFLDAYYPDWSQALRWCEQARRIYKHDGDMKNVRLLLRNAVTRVADYGAVYRAWIAMETKHGRRGLDLARVLFNEWGIRCDEDDALLGNVRYWCAYLEFEVRHGGADRARVIADAAVVACPHDRTVHAMCAKAEMRLGDADRGFAALDRALKAFARYDSAQQWLEEEVHGYYDSLKKKRRGLGGRIYSRFRHCVKPTVYEHKRQELRDLPGGEGGPPCWAGDAPAGDDLFL